MPSLKIIGTSLMTKVEEPTKIIIQELIQKSPYILDSEPLIEGKENYAHNMEVLNRYRVALIENGIEKAQILPMAQLMHMFKYKHTTVKKLFELGMMVAVKLQQPVEATFTMTEYGDIKFSIDEELSAFPGVKGTHGFLQTKGNAYAFLSDPFYEFTCKEMPTKEMLLNPSFFDDKFNNEDIAPHLSYTTFNKYMALASAGKTLNTEQLLQLETTFHPFLRLYDQQLDWEKISKNLDHFIDLTAQIEIYKGHTHLINIAQLPMNNPPAGEPMAEAEVVHGGAGGADAPGAVDMDLTDATTMMGEMNLSHDPQ